MWVRFPPGVLILIIMAKKKITTDQEPELPLITCGECARFRRDTSGRSRNIYTHEYFMGVCSVGLTPDSPIKQFADKPRRCKRYRRIER